MKTTMTVVSALLVLAAWDAQAAESKLAKRFDAGPAIQGNSDPAMPRPKKAKAGPMHKKAM